jgi:hypothetical protein
MYSRRRTGPGLGSAKRGGIHLVLQRGEDNGHVLAVHPRTDDPESADGGICSWPPGNYCAGWVGCRDR